VTSQELFDTVANHLRNQGLKCMIHGSCKYRGHGGLKCAIGALIPDSKYESWMDTTVIELRSVLWCIGLLDHLELCRDLQILHDNYPTNEWPERLKLVANKFGLRFDQ
jgi:hypothetical protein